MSANLLTGLGIDEYFTRTDSSGTMAFLADALGSTVGLVNSGGSIGTSYTYQPFGATTVSGATNANPYQFTGRENDATGLYYYRARYYSPGLDRFLSQDPLVSALNPIALAAFPLRLANSQLLNPYSYVVDDPVDFADPLGLCQDCSACKQQAYDQLHDCILEVRNGVAGIVGVGLTACAALLLAPGGEAVFPNCVKMVIAAASMFGAKGLANCYLDFSRKCQGCP